MRGFLLWRGTAAIFVNGTQVPVDMDSCIADISDYVQLGENTIQVRVTSSLRNRMIEQQYSGWMGEMQPDNYGMTGDVVLQTYTKVATVNKEYLKFCHRLCGKRESQWRI